MPVYVCSCKAVPECAFSLILHPFVCNIIMHRCQYTTWGRGGGGGGRGEGGRGGPEGGKQTTTKPAA